MKNLKRIFLLILVLGLTTGLFFRATAPKKKKLRHVVAFKFKPEITSEQMEKVTADFRNLKARIPEIIEFEGGPDLAQEKKKGKFTHCFMVTVKSQADLAVYGAHPVHKAFSKSVDPLLAEVMVVDYWTE
jgi:hypothetical protein